MLRRTGSGDVVIAAPWLSAMGLGRQAACAPVGIDELDVEAVTGVDEGDPLVLEGLAGLWPGEDPQAERLEPDELGVERSATEAQVMEAAPSQGEGVDRRARIGRLDELDLAASPAGSRKTTRTCCRVLVTISVCLPVAEDPLPVLRSTRSIDGTAMPT